MVSLVVPFNYTYGTPTGIKALEFTMPSPEFASTDARISFLE